MPSVKLNIFQRGILQKVVGAAVYFASFAAGGLILDWLEKRRFTVVVEKAQQQGIVTPEYFDKIKELIASADEAAIFFIIIIGFFCVGIAWLLIRWTANLNWSWPVMLPRAVEFRPAMDKIGIADPHERIEFVKKHKLPVFIALSPLIAKEQEAVRAKLYAFAHDSSFAEKGVFDRHIGKQTLCLDAEDYERVVQDAKKRFSLGESVALAEKNDELQSVKGALLSITEDKSRLETENAALAEDLKKCKDKLQMQPAQEEGRVDRLCIERLLWGAYIPVMEKLMREAPAGKQYTTPEIEASFATEWGQRADLRTRMAQLTGRESATPSTDFIKAVKVEFKDAGKLHPGGRPRKNP